jgi:SH3-like domain-containing protein
MLVRLIALGLALAAGPALAQTSPPPGNLALPKPAVPTPPPPPKAAPVSPVEKAASAPSKKTPVVHAPPNTHAQHPPATTAPSSPTPALAPAPAAPPAAAEPAKGSVTGLPLPRWASLRTDEVNMRVGPGTRFPIEWQYHRRDLPIKILREVEVWRLIEDQDGVKGWVHQATLVGHRGFVVRDPEALLRQGADDASPAVARLKQGVVGRIRACAAKADWCEVQVGSYRGFLRRTQFWGTFVGEAVND